VALHGLVKNVYPIINLHTLSILPWRLLAKEISFFPYEHVWEPHQSYQTELTHPVCNSAKLGSSSPSSSLPGAGSANGSFGVETNSSSNARWTAICDGLVFDVAQT
jgi:hypothetical protein